MATFTIPATKLKEEVSDVLDAVYFKNAIAIVERYGKPIAQIVPFGAKQRMSKENALDRTFGAIPDFPDVKKLRYFRKRNVTL